jgi:hypothetical protein
MPRLLKSLIQSDFRGDIHGNFEAVIQDGDSLVHWFRENSEVGSPWKKGQVIVPHGVAGAGSIIQSDFKSGDHGNFEVVVPLFNAAGTIDLWHFFHDNSDINLPWRQAQVIAANVAGEGSIIQSDFTDGDHGNFEVVVPVVSDRGRIHLVHFFHDNSDVTLPWQRGRRIASNVVGPGCIIQSDFKSGDHGNFEVVVGLHAPDGTHELWHFFHDNSDVNLPWQRAQRIAQFVNGPGTILQGDFTSDGGHGNFEVVVPVGRSLVHFFNDNSDVSLPWRRGQNVTEVANGWAAMMRSDYGPPEHGNFELLVEECSRSVVAYWHPNQDVSLPWMRDQVLVGEPYPARSANGTRKVCQLTGEYDRQGWDGRGTPSLAFNRTESRFGIRGCDLGSSFEHKNRVYFLFGDTLRVDPSQGADNLDSIAFCTDTDASNGLSLTFYKQPPSVPGMDQSGFNVPMDGLNWNGAMYVFFSTGSFQVDGRDLMGRSVFARSDNDGYDFVPLGDFSTRKFINVSVQQAVLDQAAARGLDMAPGTPVLWVWGTGRYRASAVYLSVLPLDGLERLQPIRYLAGDGTWSIDEEDAVPLVCAGDVGELSARWNPFLGRWLLLFNSGNPRGILMYSAPHPWGPWTNAPVMVFDPGRRANPNDPCSGAGYGSFMHIGWGDRVCDHVQDDMFSPGNFRDNDFGGEYGPYQITGYASGVAGRSSRIWFTMSTWNPYQSVLMTTELTADML